MKEGQRMRDRWMRDHGWMRDRPGRTRDQMRDHGRMRDRTRDRRGRTRDRMREFEGEEEPEPVRWMCWVPPHQKTAPALNGVVVCCVMTQ